MRKKPASQSPFVLRILAGTNPDERYVMAGAMQSTLDYMRRLTREPYFQPAEGSTATWDYTNQKVVVHPPEGVRLGPSMQKRLEEILRSNVVSWLVGYDPER